MGRGKQRATRATRALEGAGIKFDTLEYELDAQGVERSLGEAAAAALGVDPATVFKTLIALADGTPVCGIVPVSNSLSLKRLAAAAGAKRAEMADQRLAERVTGYVVGGISPLAQTRSLPTFVDASLLAHEHVHVSAGQRGVQIRLAPSDLVRATGAEVVEELAV